MPQLNPAPWFFILTLSWIIFLTLIPLKTTAHPFPNEPASKSTTTHKTESWNWPWH